MTRGRSLSNVTVWIVIGVAMTVPRPFAQPIQIPGRDAKAAVRHQAVLSGIVVSDDQEARPIRHARVTCSAAELAQGLTTITDDRGRFRFADLPPGHFTIRATRPGWVSAWYGATAALRPGSSISLAEGEARSITVRMPRGAVITGSLLDENGQPAVNAGVAAMRAVMQSGERRLISFGVPATTDDRGVYRIYGLPPGDFVVAAVGRLAPNSGAAARLTTDVEVHHARTVVPQMPSPPDHNVTFASTYFPGTTFVSQAGRITLRAGEERDGIDFALQLVATADVQGYVYGGDAAQAGGAQVALFSSSSDTGEFPLASVRTTVAAADGAFGFGNVPPGQYTIFARSLPSSWAVTYAVVDGERVSGLSLSLQPGLTLSGSVSFAGDRLRPPADLRTVRVALRPVQTEGAVSIAPTEVSADASGRFVISGIAPGRYQLHATFPGAASSATPAKARANGWLLRTASIGSQDTLDIPVALRPGQPLPAASVVFTDRTATLSGILRNPPDDTTPNHTIVLFPVDPSLWQPRSRRIDGVPVSPDGTFAFNNLVPGDYLAAAVDDVEPGEWFDPAFLQRIAGRATRIPIGEGEQKVHDLYVRRD